MATTMRVKAQRHHQKTSLTRLLICMLLSAVVAVSLVGCTSEKLITSDDPIFRLGSNDDNPLSLEVLKALRRNGETGSLNVKVQSKGDVVRLRGRVSTQRQAVAAEQVAYTVDGVRFVDNGLYVR